MTVKKEFTKEEANALCESRFWETLDYEERAKFQVVQEQPCMPFDVFHEAVENFLQRPVYTLEFWSNREGLIREVFG